MDDLGVPLFSETPIWCLKKFKETQEINGNDKSYVDKWMGFDGSFEIGLLLHVVSWGLGVITQGSTKTTKSSAFSIRGILAGGFNLPSGSLR